MWLFDWIRGKKNRDVGECIADAASKFPKKVKFSNILGDDKHNSGPGVVLNPDFWEVKYELRRPNLEPYPLVSDKGQPEVLPRVCKFIEHNPEWYNPNVVVYVKIRKDRAAADAIDDLWRSGEKYQFECFVGAQMVLLRGFYEYYKERQNIGQFNQRFSNFQLTLAEQNTSSIQPYITSLRKMDRVTIGNTAYHRTLKKGDYVYLYNPYLKGALNGYNAIYLGDGKFYCHPMGEVDIDKFAAEMMEKVREKANHMNGQRIPRNINDVKLMSWLLPYARLNVEPNLPGLSPTQPVKTGPTIGPNLKERQPQPRLTKAVKTGQDSTHVTSPTIDSNSPVYTVKKGDSLSAIAKRFTGSSSRWPELYAHNKTTIGNNPNLIHPNDRLIVPSSWQPRTTSPSIGAARPDPLNHSGSIAKAEYTVKKGDSLSAIAKRLTGDGRRWPELYAHNKTTIGNNPNLIHPNDRLKVPSSWQPRTTSPTLGGTRPGLETRTQPASTLSSYTVKRGDNLWDISRRFTGDGSRWRELFAHNKNTIGNNPNLIHPNEKLAIPSSWQPRSTSPGLGTTRPDFNSTKNPGSALGYTVKRGDNLSEISRRFTGDSSKWRELYDYNRGVIGKDPNRIRTNVNLAIPPGWKKDKLSKY